MCAAIVYIRVLGNDTGRRGIQLSQQEYHVTVNESAAPGTRLLRLSAHSTSGSHLGHEIFYNIRLGNDDNCFDIDSSGSLAFYISLITCNFSFSLEQEVAYNYLNGVNASDLL